MKERAGGVRPISIDVLLQGAPSERVLRQCRESFAATSGLQLRIVEDGTVSDLVRGSEAPFCIVSTGTALLPGALEQMIAILSRSAQIDVVAGACFPVDASGRAERSAVSAANASHARRRETLPDPLHVAAFDAAFGAFALRSDRLRRTLRQGEDDPVRLALRMARRGRLVVTAELVGGRVAARRGRRGLGRLARQLALLALLEGSPAASRLGARMRALAMASSLGDLARARERLAAIRERLLFGYLLPLQQVVYDGAVRGCAKLRLGALGPSRPRSGQLVYYLWRYPVLSQTFVRREIEALLAHGIDLAVVADEPSPEGPASDLPSREAPVRYLPPLPSRELRRSAIGQIARRPLRSLHLFLYVIGKRHSQDKSLKADATVFLRAAALAADLRRSRARRLHSPWGDLTAFIAMVAARLANLPFSLQFRASDLHSGRFSFLLAEKMRNADFVITNSEFNRRRLQEAQVEQVPVHRIYNGLPLEDFDPASRAAPATVPRLLSVARLIEPKGLIYLLEACDRLRREGFRFSCTIVGGEDPTVYPSDPVEIRALRARLALEERVDLVGALPFREVLENYRTSDIFVLPCVKSRDGANDVTPNALLEAMAMGLPVVSTLQTAIPELVEDGVSGLLVPPRDVGRLTAALARLLAEPELRSRLGEAARRRVEERFDVARNISSYVRLFAAA